MEQTKLKDSEVQWIGKIPEEWTVTKIKYELDFLESGGTPESSNPDFYNDDGINWVSIGDMSTNNYVYETKNKITIDAIRDKNLRIYPKNTVIYSIYATIGKVSELMVPATVNQAILAIKMNNNINQNFFKYQLETMEKEVLSLVSSNTQNNLNAFKVRNFSIVLPNIKEQQKIAKFLDDKCGNIDEIIKETKDQIETLEKYKKSLITEVVTKGLNPTASMKNSGIEWIGQIPTHWGFKKLKYLSNIKTGTTPDANDGINYNEGYNWYTPGDFNESLCMTNSEKYISKDAVKNYKIKLFPKETVLMVAIGATVGKISYIKSLSYSNQQITAIMPSERLLKTYLTYYLFSKKDFIKDNALYTTLPIINNQYLSSVMILNPSIIEQQEIVDYLDKKCAVIDEILKDKKKTIETLKQYKNSLIYEYVTGKKRV